MAQLIVLRHSLAEANEQGILMGAKLDSPLSEKGQEIARQKGKALRAEKFAPDRVYTSQLQRAKQTAEIIVNELGAQPMVIELEGLNERDFGIYDGKPYKYVLEALEKEGDNPETVEPADVFIRRVTAALDIIKNETTGTTLVITHSNPAMVMQTALFNPDNLQRFWELGDPPYCGGFTYEF